MIYIMSIFIFMSDTNKVGSLFLLEENQFEDLQKAKKYGQTEPKTSAFYTSD